MHLHGEEQDIFLPGAGHHILEIEGWRLGLAVCYDAAVPEHARAARDAGADAYVVSALYATGDKHRLLEQTSRAAALGLWVAVSQYVGATGPYRTIGRSGIWRPDGVALEQLSEDQPGLATAQLHASTTG
ncbi:putative amidohydrolase [Kitasatospora sp. MAA4]|uniref:nitrilase-related carbon-nitrogen hydrolase n=1 Tax=Kitasatospora sp. MAA4 TaxID=3035093 RepID=UPI002473A82D|nr:nitrilase-related carbon-nitrogen hydrolase [Kitasatospora sp. MAA4]MDH6134905.1 putative amidohydrolase [Kitasatospora sp. MAA4]